MPTIKLVLVFFMYFSSLVFALNEPELINIAQVEYKKDVPTEYQSEYSKFDIRIGQNPNPSIYPDAYYFTWRRVVNSVPIIDDRFVVGIYSDGKIFNKLYAFSVPSSQLDIISTLTVGQAKWVAQKAYGKIEEEPNLQIRDGKLGYVMKISSGHIISINAKTGESQILETPLGASTITQVSTSFNPIQYYLEVYGIYVILALVFTSGVIYYRKFSRIRK